MENLRMILFAALAGIVFLLYQAWQQDYAPVPTAQQQPVPSAPALPDDETGEGVPALGANTGAVDSAVQPGETAVAAGDEAAVLRGERVEIITDVYRLSIDLNGGDIRQLELLNYPLTKEQPDVPLQLLNDSRPHFFILQSGLVDEAGQLPDHKSAYRAERRRYRLGDGAEQLVVPLRWTGENGLEVEKIYRFTRGSYEVDLIYRVQNAGETARAVSPYLRMWRTPTKVGGEPPFIQSFLGAAAYLDSGQGDFKYRKYTPEELADEPLATEQQGGWIGMLQHYFVAAILPPPTEISRFYARPGKRFGFVTEYVGERSEIAAAAGRELPLRLYLGPKLQQQLEAVAPGLQLTVDYGLLTAISEPLFWVLDKLHDLTGNWGWSIILLTLLIKLAFYKLSEAQYRSMARMKKFAPRIQAIKERYADDRERLHQAMMDLYKKEGFNPLAGCWPMLVQFPVFIALYWVLLESVELRQADFIFWLNDLSSPDPYYVLPVLFGISMYLQQKLSGQAMTMEPMQQKIMNIMPVGLSIFFAFFPVGLVLYWFVSNVIGIAQQWVITRRLEREDERVGTKR